jgi:hypothetical protein
LPGVTTAKMLEELMAGYEAAFEHEFQEGEKQAPPWPIKTRQCPPIKVSVWWKEHVIFRPTLASACGR